MSKRNHMSWEEFMLYRIRLSESIIDYANYMIDNHCSLRRLCKDFLVPYTTMHKYLTEELKYIDDDLFIQCRNIMKNNKRNQKRDDRGRFV